ncbi:hypothetical protein [Tissierella sp.]|uniref:hypothetical protein n=1 Tax=Tissierella sp. TaxID=41274 RepID=UPI0028AEEF67|nr:hypothetical protein [Tissierella sp.]
MSILEVDNIELKELNIYEDKLLMRSNENKKEFANIFINIYLKLDKSLDFQESTNLSKEYIDKLMDTFSERKGGEFRLSKISVIFEFENLNKRAEENLYFKEIDKDINILGLKQSEEDFKVQTIVFNELSKNDEIDIFRLGLEDISNDYIIELNVFEVKNADTYVNNINLKNDDLIKKFSNDEYIRKYLKSNSINKLKLIYNVPWHEEQQFIYNYDL